MSGVTYRSAGVDREAVGYIVQKIKAFARITYTPNVIEVGGGFAGLYRLEGYKAPVLVASTDNVGTKLKIASYLGHYESLGIDLVNLNINDILTYGARPLLFLDYIATNKLDTQRIEALIRGMAWACREAGCSLIGGETAQLPGLYSGEDFDLSGFVVGVVEKDAIIDCSQIKEGDTLLGIPSSGLHTNGFSLVRKIFQIDEEPTVLFRRYEELNHTLGEELLIPHRCYYPLLEPALPFIKGMAHITGGGLIENVPRILVKRPEGLAARFHTDKWNTPPIFWIIQREGNVDLAEMYRVFNMGLGMVLVCALEKVAEVQKVVPEAKVVGEVVEQQGEERVVID